MSIGQIGFLIAAISLFIALGSAWQSYRNYKIFKRIKAELDAMSPFQGIKIGDTVRVKMPPRYKVG